MKFLSVFIGIVFLVGCQTVVPVKQNFPEAPKVLMSEPEELKRITSDEILLSELIGVTFENYSICRKNIEIIYGWQNWYINQKENFESIEQ